MKRCGYKLLTGKGYTNRTFALSRKGRRQAEVVATTLSRQGQVVLMVKDCDPETILTCLDGRCEVS